MNYTDYFSGINIESVINNCLRCISDLQNLDSYSFFYQISNCCESESINKLNDALLKNKNQINKTVKFINKYVRILSYASEIKKIQIKMKATSDYDIQTSLAKEITSKLNKIFYITDSFDSSTTASVGVLTASNQMSAQLFNVSSLQLDGRLRMNYNKLNSLKNEFDDYSNRMVESYNNFSQIKSSVINDSYLRYGWYKVMERYQKMLKKRDKIDNWWKGYLVNIKRLELQLPDNTSVAIKGVESKKFAGGSEFENLNITKPNSNSYTKNGITGEIKKPAKQKEIEVTSKYISSSSSSGSNHSNNGSSSRSGSGTPFSTPSRYGKSNGTTGGNSAEEIEKYKAEHHNYGWSGSSSSNNNSNSNNVVGGNSAGELEKYKAEHHNYGWNSSVTGGNSAGELEKYKAEHHNYGWSGSSSSNNNSNSSNNNSNSNNVVGGNSAGELEKYKAEHHSNSWSK